MSRFIKIGEAAKRLGVSIQPLIYQNRIEKYRKLQARFEKGEILPPKLKFFPEFHEN